MTISSPADGSRTTKRVSITASASDNVAVTSMEVLIDGQLVASSTTDSVRFSWNASNRSVANGNHTILVRAIDGAGNIGTRSITVVK